MYPGQLETLAIYWTSAVRLPHFNPSVLVLQMELTALALEMLRIDTLSIQYIDY